MEGQWSMFGMDGQSRYGMPDPITIASPTESDFVATQHLMDCVTEFPLQDSHSEAVQREEALSLLDDLVTMWTNYQLTLLEKAKKENSIVYLETGSGKTHIAVMLLLHIADVIRKPSTRIAVFLCPNVSLVQQQAKVVQQNTNLEVGTYYGEMNIDAWKSETWEAELEKKEVFVMTPAILLQNLHHCFMRMDCIELLIFDECHHADKRHPYACIMQEFYHPRSQDASYKLPRILGMTASPFHGKGTSPKAPTAKMTPLSRIWKSVGRCLGLSLSLNLETRDVIKVFM